MKLIGYLLFPDSTKEAAGVDNNRVAVFRWRVSVGAVCPRCVFPVSAVLGSNITFQHITHMADHARNLLSSEHAIQDVGFFTVETWPKLEMPSIPSHLPQPIRRALLQAEHNYPVEGNEEAAGLMYRRTLELALKEKFPALTGSLAKRISKLVSDTILPEAMGDWADEIRDLGNEAAHDSGEIDRNQLQMVRGFTDATLQYLYTLPAEVEARRKIP